MTTLTIRQNFHEEVEAAINRQINMELRASYVYQSMVCFQKKINFLLLCSLYWVLKLRVVIN